MNSVKHIVISILFVSTALFASEGSIQITGRGEAIAPPEYTEISVNVTSLCYERAQDAKNANAVLANQMVEILKAYVHTATDKVTTTGGQFVRQSEYVYLPGGTSRLLCDRKWRATNTVTLQTASIGEIAEIQDQVISATDKQGEVDPAKVSQSYAELMQPNFFLYAGTQAGLKRLAHQRAWDDAQDQLGAFKEKCGFMNMQLKSIEDPSYAVYPEAAHKAYKPNDIGTPVLPSDITVRAAWKFQWTFEQSGNCLL